MIGEDLNEIKRTIHKDLIAEVFQTKGGRYK